ncbi:MAG: hypothetical protein PHP42_12250, partial [Bacteroidota bacterium]|nr:hypothetical protein [Bacteroidota bacterium]
FPLKDNTDNPFQWNVTSNEIGVTLVSGKMKQPNKESTEPAFEGSQDESGKRAPMGMDENGEHGGGRRGRDRGDFKTGEKKTDIDFWFKVHLAELKNKK